VVMAVNIYATRGAMLFRVFVLCGAMLNRGVSNG
jgi:hypothetical protein